MSWKKALSVIKDDSGAALMMAIFTIVMLMIIATEVMYETNVEFVVSAQSVNQVRAHYAAKAGVEISLLRLHIYRKTTAALGEMAKSLPIIDMIWQMPFNWPPVVPAEVNSVEKGEINKTVKASLMQGQYLATIESESSKIDLSLLALENNPETVKRTVEQLVQIFQSKMEGDETFARKHSGTDFSKLVLAIKDWVDVDDKNDAGGGDEASLYSNINSETAKFPPNAPFKTIEELHMVAGMTDEFFALIAPRVTVYGAKAINAKYASKEVLKIALALTDDQVDRLIQERDKKDTTIMKDVSTFLEFVVSLGVRKENLFDSNTGQPKVGILVEPEFNFRIRSTGISGKVQRDITAIVYDYDRVLAQLKSVQPKPTPTATPGGPGGPPGGPGTPTPSPTATPSATPLPVPNERPNIVYWNET